VTSPYGPYGAPYGPPPPPYGAPPPYAAYPYAGPGLPPPVAVETVDGTPFAVAIVPVPPRSSGQATASLPAGIACVLVSLVVSCFGLYGASSGWGPIVAGAFAVLAGFAGGAAVVLGVIGLRQARRGGVTGRGLAVAGVACGTVGLLITVLAVGLSVAMTVTA
jgi:hypothetical protein